MKLEHSFTVPVAVDEAWKILLDVERIAPCMPGATLESVNGDEFTGNVKVKLGAINLTYKGKASFVEKDEAAHRAVLDARGRDSRGNGTAAAKVTTQLTDEGGSTKVLVNTDLDITGKVAQFGRGVMVDVGNKLIGQFADCLAKTITSGNEPATPASVDTAAEAEEPPADAPAGEGETSPAGGGAPADATAAAEATAAVGAAGGAARPARGKTAAAQSGEPAKATKAAAKATKRARPRPTKPPAETESAQPPAAVLDADAKARDAADAAEPAASGTAAATTGAAEAGPAAATAQPDETAAAPSEAPLVDESAAQAVSEAPGYSAPAQPAEAAEPAAAAPVNGRTAAAAEREVEPINLLESAGPALVKRAAPPAAVLLLLILFVILRRRRP